MTVDDMEEMVEGRILRDDLTDLTAFLGDCS